ncbi:MAG: TonB-dependent receptor [Betaproteobacteria bacterium]|nr:MAG: TonB-dependent receptor [Betaproteobacteria bacterium]
MEEEQTMKSRSKWQMRITIVVAAFACACLPMWQPAQAQLSTATLRGWVQTAAGQGAAGVEVSATSTESGFVYRTRSNSDGSYVLSGLPPGTYQIRTGTEAGQKPQTITVDVGETASIDLVLPAVPIEQVQIVGSFQRADVKDSEVATSVSPTQMQLLPQVTRNFLSFADLAPGVRVTQDPGSGYVTLQSGAQNQDNINVYIDGVSQKNYVLRGGLVGQDSSRGNPFPQSALSEYRIVSQNYKAEFDQVSSVAITAVTRSGTNQLHGDAFVDYTGNDFVAYSPFEEKNRNLGIKRPGFDQEQFGVSLGGPIIQDRIHYFVAYEGKNIGSSREVGLGDHAYLVPDAGLAHTLRALQGTATDKFTEHLVFTKFDAEVAENQRVELSAKIRREDDLVPEDPNISAPDNQKDRKNNENHVDLKHEWTLGDWLNEARVGYQDAEWNPHSNSTAPLIKYNISPPPTPSENNMFGVIDVGGSPDAQDRIQKGFYLQDDLTFGGVADHAFKGGFKVDFITFNLSGTAFSVPTFVELLDPVTGNLTMPPTGPANPLADRTINAAAPTDASFKDTMLGLYFQDDWDVTHKLQLNLGVRWDYETNMLDNDYVTPADRVNALLGPDSTRYNIAPAPGQTYEQSLALGGIHIRDYISNGSSRKPFTGAIQPRVGFSYDLWGDKQTVFFGGYGRAYDRKVATNALDEKQKNQTPGKGEIWLLKNDFKAPYTDQYGVGVRQGVGTWNTEFAYTYSYSHHQFNWFGGDRDPHGGWDTKSIIDPLFSGPVGYGTLVLGDFISEAKTQTLYFKADKPYTPSSGWGATVAYTYSDAFTTNRQWSNDIFNWTYGKPGVGWYPSVDVERHRIVATGITDRLLPLGIVVAGKWTYGSGLPYQITDCHLDFSHCIYLKGDGGHFDQTDISLSKRFGVGFGGLTVRLDILNIFGIANYGGYDGFAGGPTTNPVNRYGGDNANVGQPSKIVGPMRTYKFGLRYDF